MTIFSSESTLEKIAWLNEKEKIETFSNLQLQKFLFFYEMLQYSDNKQYDFASLKAYENGPVFSKFYGDITYNKNEVLNRIAVIPNNQRVIDSENADISYYIISSLNDKELSDLTHQFNIWRVHKRDLEIGKKQIPMSEQNITNDDLDILTLIKSSVPDYDYEVLKIGGKRFIVNKEQIANFSDSHLELLDRLSRDDDLLNPVFVELDEFGRLIID